MRRTNLFITVVFTSSLLCCFVISTVSAQPLDGIWFKLKGKAAFYAVDSRTEDVVRGKFVDTAYLSLVWSLIENRYNFALYVEAAPDSWLISDSGTKAPVFDYFFPDWGWQWNGEEGSNVFVNLYHTAVITPTKKGFRYKGWGEVIGGGYGTGNIPYGGITITGASIDPSKLPFVP